MDNAPTEAPAPAPTGESVETPNTNTESAAAPQMPDMHGFTSDDLASMRTFIDNNGGWDKIKSRISNPQPQQTEPVQQQSTAQTEPTSHTQPQEPVYRAPQGAITADEFRAQQYFTYLAGEEKYKSISEGIRNGDYLKEMSQFGIQALNQDGSINDQKVRMYLDLKAQTVPAKPTGSEPDASAAPTVTYTQVGDGGIKSIDEAYKIIMEKGNPNMAKAEEFIKNSFNKK